jgi:single-stranded DNA-binding protein
MFYGLFSGCLTADPQRRQGSKAPFATGSLRVQDGEDSLFVSLIAFGDKAEELLEHAAGAAIAVSGRAKLTSWMGRDGAEKRGISVVVEQVAAAKPRRRSATAPQHRPAGARGRYSPPSSTRDSGPPLPQDRVDDLYAEDLVP